LGACFFSPLRHPPNPIPCSTKFTYFVCTYLFYLKGGT
jgi:hypothetical protein